MVFSRRFKRLASSLVLLFSAAAASGAGGAADFAAIYEKASAATLEITVKREVKQEAAKGTPFALPSQVPFSEFFNNLLNGPEGEKKVLENVGLGTGFVIDGARGYAVTNCHVVQGGDIYSVVSRDERFEASLVGCDSLTDIALIRLKADHVLPQLDLAEEGKIRIASTVMAIGNPKGFTLSASVGIVSGLHRQIGHSVYDDFIQTDAAINLGNSGGPLIGEDGTVIGMNTLISTESGGSEGLGFAVPAPVVRFVTNSLIESGKVVRGRLGAEVNRLYGGMTAPRVGVVSVEPGGAAGRAGILPGDGIILFGGRHMDSPQALLQAVSMTPPGSRVDILLLRDGRVVTLRAEIDAFEAAVPVSASSTPVPRM